MTEEHQPDLGYLVYPPQRHDAPGSPRVEFILAEHPSGKHFDPRSVELPVADSNGRVYELALAHPCTLTDGLADECEESGLHLLAGKIIVADYVEKRLEFFSFGGELMVIPQETFTRLVLTSEAPILMASSAYTADGLFIEQAQTLLALRRGVWELQPNVFEQRLTTVRPLELYHAFIMAVLARFKSLHLAGDEAEREMVTMLNAEARDTLDLLKGFARNLEEVL